MTSEVDRRVGNKARSGQSRRGQTGQQRDSEFVNYELTQEQVGKYRLWRADVDSVDLLWKEACENGYKFSVKYDDYSSAFAVFMFPSEGDENSGYILTGRGGTPFRAMCECLYKHFEVLGGDWRSTGRSPVATDDPDW